MITLQQAVSSNPAGGSVNTASAARAGASGDGHDGAAADGLDFAALMAAMVPDSPQGVAAAATGSNADTSEGKSGSAGGDAGAMQAQAADAAPGREGPPAGAGTGLAAQIEGAMALEGAIATAAARADATPPAGASIQSSGGAKPAGWQGMGITSSRTAADAPGARGPGKQSPAAEPPGKPATTAADAPWPSAMTPLFDGSARGAVSAHEVAALSSPATGDAQAAHHAQFQASQPQSRASEHAFASAAHGARLDAPLGSARWREDLAGQISVMVRDATTQAEIRVTPPELGPIQARISVDNGVATVWLSAPAPETRDALEAALATLRERLAESGIGLGETSVSEDRGTRFENRAPLPDGEAERGDDRAGRGDDRAGRDAQGRGVRIEGLVDLYA